MGAYGSPELQTPRPKKQKKSLFRPKMLLFYFIEIIVVIGIIIAIFKLTKDQVLHKSSSNITTSQTDIKKAP